jgi:hypothetical protein
MTLGPSVRGKKKASCPSREEDNLLRDLLDIANRGRRIT